MPRNPNCRNCGLWKGAVNVCVWGDGSNQSRIVAIGEAPGEAEARTGKPFMGRSGKLLRAELSKAGLRDVYITNIVKCRPPDNRDPTPDEIKACRPYLEEELATVKPEYVVTLGKPATKAVFKKSKITEVHGQFIDGPNFRGMPAFHPAYVLRDPSKLPAFRKDIERLRRDMHGETWDSEVEWELVNSSTLRRFVSEFERAHEFSFDLETSGLFPFRQGEGTITCVNIGIHDRAWLLPMDMIDSPRQRDIGAQRRLMRYLYELSKNKIGIAHNGKFDNHWLFNKYGFRFHLSFDTMLAHHVLDENTPHDLEYLARFYLEADNYDIPLKEKQNPSLIGLQKFYEYTGKDAIYTLRLKKVFRDELKKDKQLYDLFYKMVMPAARALGEIEQEGITWDMPAFHKKSEDLVRERAERKEELDRLAAEARPQRTGPRKALNWNSPQQVGPLLYDDLGIECKVFTAKGARSTSEEAVLELKGKHAVVDALLAYREKVKFHATYFEGFEPLIVDGRLYISYKIHGTVTGRYSSRLHSIPRDGSVRSLGTAPPGWDFFQGDLSQAELRIAAELSGDLELRRCFAPGGPDVHWSTLLHNIETGPGGEYVQPAIDTARALAASDKVPKRGIRISEAVAILRKAGHDAAIEINKIWKEARKRAKAVNFGFIYGMWEKKFIETCKIKYGFEPTFEEAHAFREAYFALYRGIPAWHERVKKLLALDGFVRSLSGRIRRLPGIHSGDKALRMECERQAINSPVQGFIGDYKAMCMVEIHERVDPEWVRLTGEHHDALLGMVRRAESPKDEIYRSSQLRLVKSIMRKPRILGELGVTLSTPMEAEIEIGCWGAGKTWKDPNER